MRRAGLNRRRLVALLALQPLLAVGLADAAVPQKGDVVAWPAISLLDGVRIEAEHLRGRPVVVVFWSLDCGYCERHNAHVEKLYRASAGSGLLVLGAVNERNSEAVRKHMAARRWSFPVTLDSPALASALGARRSVPFTVTVSRDGRLVELIPGEMVEDDVMSLRKLTR